MTQAISHNTKTAMGSFTSVHKPVLLGLLDFLTIPQLIPCLRLNATWKKLISEIIDLKIKTLYSSYFSRKKEIAPLRVYYITKYDPAAIIASMNNDPIKLTQLFCFQSTLFALLKVIDEISLTNCWSSKIDRLMSSLIKIFPQISNAYSMYRVEESTYIMLSYRQLKLVRFLPTFYKTSLAIDPHCEAFYDEKTQQLTIVFKSGAIKIFGLNETKTRFISLKQIPYNLPSRNIIQCSKHDNKLYLEKADGTILSFDITTNTFHDLITSSNYLNTSLRKNYVGYSTQRGFVLENLTNNTVITLPGLWDNFEVIDNLLIQIGKGFLTVYLLPLGQKIKTLNIITLVKQIAYKNGSLFLQDMANDIHKIDLLAYM